MGRPATGRTTKVIRVPKDFDELLAVEMYYDWLPKLLAANQATPKTPRHYYLGKLLDDLNISIDTMNRYNSTLELDKDA